MKVDELTEEMLEEARRCKTHEERMKFIADNKIELSPDLLEGASGGGGEGIDTGCQHKWKFIGRKKGVIWGYNSVYECELCQKRKIEWDD